MSALPLHDPKQQGFHAAFDEESIAGSIVPVKYWERKGKRPSNARALAGDSNVLGLEDLCAVNRDRQMLGIHAVLIGPQLGAGIRTIGVNGKACNNLGIGDDNSKVVVLSVICFSNLNSSLTGSAVVAVVESAP